MYRLRVVTDLDECQALWTAHMPAEQLTDLWDVRACFQRQYNRRPHFVVAEDHRGVRGLLPMSFVVESHTFCYFPGETWNGKSWLEQNRLFTHGNGALRAMLGWAPSRYHLRYLLPSDGLPERQRVIDEVGYLFEPSKYDYSMENYYQEFSHKSIKRILKEVDRFQVQGVTLRHDIEDFDLLVRMNIERYGDQSYFFDRRFFLSMHDLVRYLHDRDMLRVTTVLVGGEPAAVDIGAVYNGAYSLLAGGTNANFPGIAKLINLHHMAYACENRFKEVDFLCGEFSWKPMFHLTPRPLYVLSNLVTQVDRRAVTDLRRVAHAG